MAASSATHMCYVCAISVLLTVSNGFVLHHEDNNTLILAETSNNIKNRVRRNSHGLETSIHHYAIHGLCSHFKGQKHFYQVMKAKLCGLKGRFVADLVIGMCRDKDAQLFKWVKELFDIDGDGYISYYEKHFHAYDA